MFYVKLNFVCDVNWIWWENAILCLWHTHVFIWCLIKFNYDMTRKLNPIKHIPRRLFKNVIGQVLMRKCCNAVWVCMLMWEAMRNIISKWLSKIPKLIYRLLILLESFSSTFSVSCHVANFSRQSNKWVEKTFLKTNVIFILQLFFLNRFDSSP